MTAPVAARELSDRLKGLIGWALGYLLLIGITAASYPSIKDQPGVQQFVDDLPKAIRVLSGGTQLDFTSAEGLVNSRLFALILPIFVLIYAIAFGARSIAGEHEDGRLDLVLSYPLSRGRLLDEKAAVLTIILLLFGAVTTAGLTIGGLPFDLGLRVSHVVAASIMLVVLGLFFGAVAMLVGSVTLERTTAIAVAAGLAAAGYLVNSLAAIASWMEPLRPISPFWWYGRENPLQQGLDLVGFSVLLGGAAIAYAATLFTFERRDLAR